MIGGGALEFDDTSQRKPGKAAASLLGMLKKNR
jgi:hypothetical protein